MGEARSREIWRSKGPQLKVEEVAEAFIRISNGEPFYNVMTDIRERQKPDTQEYVFWHSLRMQGMESKLMDLEEWKEYVSFKMGQISTRK